MNPTEIIVCTGLVVISSFLSASEVALFSLSRIQLKTLKENFEKAYKRISKLVGDPRGLLFTILVLNELVNVSLSTVIANAVSRNWDSESPVSRFLEQVSGFSQPWVLQTIVSVLLISPIILFLCEIPPKVIGAKLNRIVSQSASIPMKIIFKAFYPLRKVYEYAEAGIVRILRVGGNKDGSEEGSGKLREADFLMMVEEGRKEGMIKEGEVQLIRNIFNLDDVTVGDVMTDIRSVYALQSNCKIEDAIQSIRKKNYYRIPIYKGNKRSIVGVLYAKDLVQVQTDQEMKRQPVTAIMRKPFVVRSTSRVNTLFRRLKQYQTHMAVVKDQDEVIGIVTMDDVLDEIFEKRNQ